MPIPLETPRLILRHFTLDDAPFILRLLNEPSWVRFIGDRGVRTAGDARIYLESKLIASYARDGFGFYMVEDRANGAPMGMCGLIKRGYLEDVDIGFAFLPEFWGHGHACEASSAVMEHARRDIGLRRIVAITLPDNDPSIKLLRKLGMELERRIKAPGEDEELLLFAREI